MTDTHTSRLLREATHDLTPDVDELVRGGVDRGRVLRRRRRVGTSLAAAAVIGVVGIAASVGPGLLGEDGDGRGEAAPVATDPSVPAPPSSPPSSPVERDADNADRWTDIDRAQMPGTLVQMLPPGYVTDRTYWPHDVQRVANLVTGEKDPIPYQDLWGDTGFYQGGSAVLDDGLVTVLVGADGDDAPEWTFQDDINTCQQTPNGTCIERPDGSWMASSVEEGNAGLEPTGVLTNTVSIWRPDGGSITVTAYNAAEENGPPTLTDPVLTSRQVEAIALDPVWFNAP